ncbi:DUF6054 family protein [Tsukamurella sp. 8F]|uniref:DUF6054 family protein n=1 Tax=unclassified Tsukamurella TaxID=2633480 RepID=UPI0023B90069|nr:MULTISPECIES: DUF6054 family protein [unclassified Tsukamurella]MDF0529131.1 DUF6054 family protein [Tsukamurella sp. 8J]MDF0588119.1 DUF6054 family protein [Tsukamurella sp. 8F]
MRGDFTHVLDTVHQGVLSGSASASYEDGSDITVGGVRCAVRVYERYSFSGSNRLSLTLTLLASADDLYLSAITSGGSQAVMFKLNTFGEQAFLDKVVRIVDRL